MVNLPLVVSRDDGARFFDPDVREALLEGKYWAEADAALTGLGAIERDLAGKPVRRSTRGMRSTYDAHLYRDRRTGVPDAPGGRGVRLRARRRQPGQGPRGPGQSSPPTRPSGSGRGNAAGPTSRARPVTSRHGRPLALGQLGRVIAEERPIAEALTSRLKDGAWLVGQGAYVLGEVASARNPAAHGEAVTRARGRAAAQPAARHRVLRRPRQTRRRQAQVASTVTPSSYPHHVPPARDVHEDRGSAFHQVPDHPERPPGRHAGDLGGRSARRRPPINVALVLDRSGSMDGAPLAAAREAAGRFAAFLPPRIVCRSSPSTTWSRRSMGRHREAIPRRSTPSRRTRPRLDQPLRRLAHGPKARREGQGRGHEPGGAAYRRAGERGDGGPMSSPAWRGRSLAEREHDLHRVRGALQRGSAGADGPRRWRKLLVRGGQRPDGRHLRGEIEGLVALAAQNVEVEVRLTDPRVAGVSFLQSYSVVQQGDAWRVQMHDLYATSPKALGLVFHVEDVQGPRQGAARRSRGRGGRRESRTASSIASPACPWSPIWMVRSASSRPSSRPSCVSRSRRPGRRQCAGGPG